MGAKLDFSKAANGNDAANPVYSRAIRAATHRKTDAVQRRCMRMRELSVYLGIGKSTAYQWIAEGRLPAADVRLGPNVVAWDIATIDAWIESKRVPSTNH